PLVVERPVEHDPQPPWRVGEHGGEDVPAVAPYRAHLGPARNSRAQLDAVIGRLVGVREHLHPAHRGQRYPQIAVDRPALLRGGQIERQLAALDPQLRHPLVLLPPAVNRLALLPAGRRLKPCYSRPGRGGHNDVWISKRLSWYCCAGRRIRRTTTTRNSSASSGSTWRITRGCP